MEGIVATYKLSGKVCWKKSSNSIQMLPISENAREKRIQYLNLWQENGVVSRGEIETLRVSDFEIDDLLFTYDDANDNFEYLNKKLISELN